MRPCFKKLEEVVRILLIAIALPVCSAEECKALGKYPMIGGYVDCDTVFQQNGIWYGIPDYEISYWDYGNNEIVLIAPWQAIDWDTLSSIPSEEQSEERYTGDIYVPDYVDFEEVRYTVTMVSDRTFESAESMTSLRIPPIRELTQATFDNTKRLKRLAINGDVIGGEHSFSGSGIKELTLTSPHFDKVTYAGEQFGGLRLDLLKVDKCDTLIIGSITSANLCMEVEDCGYLCLSFPFSHHYAKNGPHWAPKYMVWRCIEPPVVEVDNYFKQFCPDEWEDYCKLKNTVLFVPDESIELYRNRFFWKDFFSIHGLSELDRVDEFIAETAEVRQISHDKTPTFTIEGNQLILRGNGEHWVAFYTFMGVCLDRHTYGEGMVKLPAGTDIVVVDGLSQKVMTR